MKLKWDERQFSPNVCLNALEIKEMLVDILFEEGLTDFIIELLCHINKPHLQRVKEWLEEAL
jgi:hypothetical protein